MTTPLSEDIQPGTVLAGKFRIERILGQGAMGVVVAARHLRLDEDVAIKFLLPSALSNKEAVARFEREAQAAAKIRSEHVARVSDVGRLESGAPYMVMEHLSGLDLKQYLTEQGPLPVEEAIHYLLQASEALAEAHALGIVHRDLKPANMFRITRVDGSPSVKILDFGISKLQNADVSMTQTATMMGSPYYMSPEQMSSAKDVDPRTDIWAMGVIVHQLLTGSVPFEGATIAEVCATVLSKTSPRLADFRDDIPLGLQEALDRALEKKREDRFSNMAEFAQALAPFGQSEDVMSAERVSRVLGVSPFSTASVAGEATMMAPPFEYPKEDAEQTLKGAAHSGRPYKPPTKSGGALVWTTAAAICLVGAGVYFTNQDKAPMAPSAGAIPTDATPEKSKVEADASSERETSPTEESPAPADSAPTRNTDEPTPAAKVEKSEVASPSPKPAAEAKPSGQSGAAPKTAADTASLRKELADAMRKQNANADTAPAVEPAKAVAAPPTETAAPETQAPAASDPMEYYRDRR